MNRVPRVNKKIIIYIFLFVLFGVIVLLTIINVIKQKKLNNIPSDSNTSSITSTSLQEKTQKNPSYKKDAFIPTYSPEKGKGVDLEAPLVVNSMKEIQKLYPFLPYEEIIKTPTNEEVTIIIPDKISQTNPWTLQVYVYGLDYQLAKENLGYVALKNSFSFAASTLYTWIEQKGADPKKIMIIWDDSEFIQNKSQELLK